MKKLLSFLMLFVLVVLVPAAFGADVVPAVAPASSTFSSIVNWMQNNQVAVGLFMAAIIDFIFAINPQWKSNGALHFIYVLAQRLSGKTPQE